MRDAVYETVAAGLGPVREGRFLLPGTDRRPADVLVPNWAGGKDAAMDVKVPSRSPRCQELPIRPASLWTTPTRGSLMGLSMLVRKVGRNAVLVSYLMSSLKKQAVVDTLHNFFQH